MVHASHTIRFFVDDEQATGGIFTERLPLAKLRLFLDLAGLAIKGVKTDHIIRKGIREQQTGIKQGFEQGGIRPLMLNDLLFELLEVINELACRVFN